MMIYNILMNGYGKGGQHYKLPQLLKEMVMLELKSDSITYCTMIYAYARVHDFSRAPLLPQADGSKWAST
jgi:pentatricopeptide repeat protein